MNTKTLNKQKLINIVTALMTVDDEYFIETLENVLKEIKKFNEHDKVHVYLMDFTSDIVELSQWDIDLYIR
jgi:hypothetical protein